MTKYEKMKRFFTTLAALVMTISAFAQSAEDIVANMTKVMDEHKNDGLVMTMDIKIPILGTMSTRAWSLGGKVRIEGKMMGQSVISWSDGTTKWSYDPKENTIEIENDDPSKSEAKDNASMLSGATDGYDVSIKKESESEWLILCKKNKDNKEKDDPKTMELTIAKGTYHPMKLKSKLRGVSVSLYDIGFDVSENDVTFDPSAYPGAKIVDKRQ